MMKELEQILRQQAAQYPKMQPTDAVKLIYQNEFGGGHLIKDEAVCLNYLRREYDATPKNPAAQRQEYIGNGIYRVNLAALEKAELEALGQAFIRSAAAHKGTLQRFLEKVSLPETLAGEGIFSFDSGELSAYLTDYKAQGYPAVSHSQSYRESYHPAYRIAKDWK